MSYLQEMKLRLENENFPEFMQLWEEYKTSQEFCAEEVVAILETVAESEYSELFGEYAVEALDFLDKLNQQDQKGEVLKLILDLQTTQSPLLADAAISYLTEKYGSEKLFKEKIRLVGLRSRDSFQGAIRNFELLNHMDKGKFIYHKGGWGTGEIMDISLIREQLSIEFENIMDTRELSFQNAFANLEPLPDDHFLSRRYGDPDAFEAEAKKDPLGVFKLLLKDLGSLNAQEIKEEIYELVIPPQDWAKWWQSVRAKAKKDPKIEVPSGTKQPFKLLEKEISYIDVFKKLLGSEISAGSFLSEAYSFVKQHPEVLKDADCKSQFREKLLHYLDNCAAGQETLQIEIYLFLEEFYQDTLDSALNKIIEEATDIQYLVQSIQVAAFKKKFLAQVKKERKDWKELFSDLFFSSQHHFIREYILKQLSKLDEGTYLKEAVEKLVDHPQMYPECFVWYFQKVQESDELPYTDQAGKNLFFESLFILLHHIEHSSSYVDLTKKVHQMIINKHFQLFRDNIALTDIDQAREILLLVSKCHLFSSHDLKVFLSLAKVVHPQLDSETKSSEQESTDHTIWTTQEGYQKVQERIRHIATVETVDNAKEIEIARSYGDLRENAEYKFAQERRSRLQAEMKLLSSQLSQARIISPEDIDTKKISVGTIVSLVSKNNTERLYTILGPWDADPDKGVLSFQSQLAKSMLGRAVNESFSFKNDEYTVKDIKSYLG